MNTNFLIDDNELREAQAKCAGFSDKKVRNKAIANVFAAKVAEKFFEEAGKEVDLETSLQCAESIVAKCDISDIYVEGNYVDVRLYFNEDEIFIPAQEFNDEILPLAYMFVKFQKDLLQAEVTGFMLPDTITVLDDKSKQYSVNENALIPFEEIEYLFREAEDAYNVDDSEIYSAIDGSISDIKDFVKKLLHSYDGRKRFIKAYHAQSVLTGMEIDKPESIAAESDEEIYLPDSQEDFSDSEDLNIQEEDYDYSTVVSPNLPEETAEVSSEENQDEFVVLEQELDNMDVDAEKEIPDETVSEVPAEEIETLFDNEESQDTAEAKELPKRKSLLPLLLLLLILLVGGYFGYTKFAQTADVLPDEPAGQIAEEQSGNLNADSDAMPVETVEKAQESVSKNEGNSVSIPAIEQNLDASILVSNLRIDWEVPSGYVTNTQAKRYLVKLGKIIQLNLKAELLLLNKPPITNRITIELKYNNTSKCFETVGILASSGENTVDNLILQTVKKALETKMNISTESFEKLSGNPVLVIKL